MNSIALDCLIRIELTYNLDIRQEYEILYINKSHNL